MRARIITIGDEIIIGQIVDTNSAWISAKLNDMGVRVVSRLSVGDDEVDIMEAIEGALAQSDVVVVTGGLGPTKDDITKRCLAQVFECGMKEDRATYEMVERMLAERGIDFNVLNKAQAMVPQACEVMPNRNGTAPGMWFERGGAVLVSLPGVPFEMKVLMDEEVLPRIAAKFRLSSIIHRTIMVVGIAESALAITIEKWEDDLPAAIKLAYLPSLTGIRLRLSAYDVDGQSVEAEIERRFEALKAIIPDHILGNGGDSAESDVAAMVVGRGETLSVAESCSGGVVSSRFTAMAGASRYFLCGVVAYSNEAKVNVLGVNAADVERYSAVSREVAEQMAIGVRRISGSDYSVATTGVAGPGGGTEQKPVGLVWIAVAHGAGVVSKRLMLGKLREQNIARTASNAINMLRDVVRKAR